VNSERSLPVIETSPILEKLKTPPYLPAAEVAKVSPDMDKSRLGLSMKNAPPSLIDYVVVIEIFVIVINEAADPVM
jgi:hypothetical protein